MARTRETAPPSKKTEAAGGITDAGAELVAKAAGSSTSVPGPSPNPATNLIIQDIALRAGGRLVRHTMEKGLLHGRFGQGTAKAIVENRSLSNTLVSALLARLATRSLPGAVVIGGGLAVKTLYDRSRTKRQARRSGDRTLRKMAED
ncbi:hypothetical protein [Parafrankia sp. BMG5.11]|uniref:hypothetical protein n=1 Tax=Parafrankia sp. BMG5.11 TaxID=222540 RepID=UPI00103B91B0|nr:hypothetical protein [Parafrankia sp. BMG5.11]TCJ38354.1 hypothetical protein E0504_15475 [Parafrankia sp. BMG5.11]